MNILITNDDGWGTPGIQLLTREMSRLGDVYVVAPNGPRSAFSSKVSIGGTLYLEAVETPDMPKNVHIYTTDGTPADCIKLAMNVVMKDITIDLVVSGINHGHNCSINLLYSGTMGAALVAAENGIPAIGFSIDDHSMEVDLSYMKPYIKDITEHLLAEPIPYGVCYNINAPVGPIEGIRWTRQCQGFWQKEINPITDAQGKPCYQLVGDFVNREPEATDTDMWAITHHLLSVQPVSVDMTHYGSL